MMDFCQGPNWKPRSTTKEAGTCGACGKALEGRLRWFCRSRAPDPDNCRARYMMNHDWGYAAIEARRRARGRCHVCQSQINIEVNHITPRQGRGYALGCHNHQDGLEVLCRPHHQKVTNRQRAEARTPQEQITMEMT